MLSRKPWHSQRRRYTICPGRNPFALAVKSGNNKIVYLDILTAFDDVTNDLSMQCREQRIGAATGNRQLLVRRRHRPKVLNGRFPLILSK